MLLEGALILLAGILLGRILPGRRREPDLPKPVCGCTHHHSMHDPQTGKCNAAVEVGRYNASGGWVGKDYHPCACLSYSGPVPLPSVYAPEIAGE
jgi:hypothetical protein